MRVLASGPLPLSIRALARHLCAANDGSTGRFNVRLVIKATEWVLEQVSFDAYNETDAVTSLPGNTQRISAKVTARLLLDMTHWKGGKR